MDRDSQEGGNMTFVDVLIAIGLAIAVCICAVARLVPLGRLQRVSLGVLLVGIVPLSGGLILSISGNTSDVTIKMYEIAFYTIGAGGVLLLLGSLTSIWRHREQLSSRLGQWRRGAAR